MPPPKGSGQRGGWRTSQKQQRELDAKMHQTLRTLMFAAYEREEAERQGNQNDAHIVKDEDELADECDLDLEPRLEMKPVRHPVPVEPEPQPEADRIAASEPSLQPTAQQKGDLLDDGYQNEGLFDDEELFDMPEEKVQ
ncbi:hypothetical protein COOONC_23062, partial [Cooperia oncophora]